jgi:glycosyltransferase involved in cell wall biosynthesis
MSPVGVNSLIVEDGINGFLAQSTEEWKEKLIRLLDNKDLRINLGKNGKRTIEERFSVNSNKEKYLNLFK